MFSDREGAFPAGSSFLYTAAGIILGGRVYEGLLVNYTKVLFRRNYRIIGVNATLTIAGIIYPQSGQPAFRAIDMTTGVDLGAPIAIETTLPMASILSQSLIDMGLTIDDINDNTDECVLNMNGVDRKVTSAKLMPSPAGEDDGEIYLFLEAI